MTHMVEAVLLSDLDIAVKMARAAYAKEIELENQAEAVRLSLPKARMESALRTLAVRRQFDAAGRSGWKAWAPNALGRGWSTICNDLSTARSVDPGATHEAKKAKKRESMNAANAAKRSTKGPLVDPSSNVVPFKAATDKAITKVDKQLAKTKQLEEAATFGAAEGICLIASLFGNCHSFHRANGFVTVTWSEDEFSKLEKCFARAREE